MITKEIFKNILGSKIDASQYLLMKTVNNNHIDEFLTVFKAKAILEALIKKEYLIYIGTTYSLTTKGVTLINEIENTTAVNMTITKLETTPYLDQVQDIYTSYEAIIKAKTTKNKFMNPSGKYYNCSLKELDDRIQGFFKRFEGYTMAQIKGAILAYTVSVVNGAKYPVRLIYFIWNEKGKTVESEMINWMDKEEEEPKTIYEGTNI